MSKFSCWLQTGSNMFIADGDNGLKNVDMDFMLKSLSVFQADMTCCRRNHEGQDYCDKETLVLPVLGLWFRVLAAGRGLVASEGKLQVHKVYSADLEKYLPTEFEYTQMNGRAVTRPLFGDLIQQVTKIVDKLSDEELADLAKE